MLAKRIIPCLDVRDGRVVKGINFVRLRDAGDPVENAKAYEEQEADELTYLDITASPQHRKIILGIVERTAEEVFMPLTVGGGIRNLEDIRDLLNSGADKVSINTAAVKNADLVGEAAARFGTQCIVVAIDGKRVPSQEKGSGSSLAWEVYIYGGRTSSGVDVLEWAQKMESLGAGEILLTSMDKDGTRQGYDLELTKVVSDRVTIPVIASGGAGKLEHIYEVLTRGKADAALAASIFHFREYTIYQVKQYLRERGIPVRL